MHNHCGLPSDGQIKSRVWLWLLSAFCATILSSGLVVAVLGTGETGTAAAVKVSAVLSFLMFFAAYAGSPLAFLWGPLFAGLARRGREFGLAFAAALTVHLGLVFFTIERSPRPFVPSHLIVAEIVGAIWIYVLAGLSVSCLQSVFSPAVWRRLRILGMHYVAVIFVRNFAHFRQEPVYLPLFLLAVGAIVLRIAAAIRSDRPQTAAI